MHNITGAVERFEVPGKRTRGLPRAGAVAPKTDVTFRLLLEGSVVDEVAVEKLRRSKTHRVLITDHLDRDARTDAPTAEVIWALFSDLVLLVLTVPGAPVVHRLQGIDDVKKRVLEMLGGDIQALTTPKNCAGPSK